MGSGSCRDPRDPPTPESWRTGLSRSTVSSLVADLQADGFVGLVEVGATGVALYLLAKIMKDPERVGAWLPRLVAGWHKGQRDREKQRHKRKVEETQGQLLEAEIGAIVARTIASTAPLVVLKPVEVTVWGAPEPPEDIAEADKESS
jgi:hypothetical protein